jgi:hypothetical protein
METKLIYKKLLAIMTEVGSVGKDRKNQSQGYNFRGIDDVMNELHEKFSQHGVFILTDIVDQRREERATKSGGISIYSVNTYRFTFMAEDGSSVQSTQIGEGMDSGDKASNKAASVALKYALLFMFLIPTQDAKDPEIDSHELKAEKKPTQQLNSQPSPKPEPKKASVPVALIPTLPIWKKVIDGLQTKGKKKSEWPEIKKSYIISEAHENQLFSEMKWA